MAKVWLSIFVVAVLSASGLRADNVTGAVHNQTTKTPAAGDDVVLLRLGNGMEEEARTKTDAQGAFSLAGQSARAAYVVRVLHEGVNYDQTVKGSAPLEMNVFDVVSKVKGLSGGIGMVQMEADGKMLKVTEMYAITNSSNPPRTQSGPHNFEISLPEKAALDLVEARRSEGVWIKTPPVAMPGQPERYAINFPIRPGDTLFKYTYHMPYSGAMRFHLRLPYPIRKFAVMHPPSISFRPLQQGAFVNPGMTNGLEIEKVVSEPLMGNVPAFEVSGIGLASAPPAIAQTTPVPQVSAPPVPTSIPPGNRRGGLTTTATSPTKTLWLLLLGGGILAVGVLTVWKMRRDRAPQTKPPSGGQPLIEALKEELFQLELDRAQGSISADDYAATKRALSHGLQRAMAKKADC